MPRRIEFKRNPDYWARDLAVRRGHFNFDRVVYRNYSDNADRAGGLQGRRVRPHQGVPLAHLGAPARGRQVGDGASSRPTWPPTMASMQQPTTSTCAGPSSRTSACARRWATPTTSRRSTSTKVFTRANSAFNNSEFAAEGLPSPGELKLLEPFRAELPPRVFGPAFVAPRTERPQRACAEPAQGARAARRRPAGSSTPTACCATPRARPSSSSTCSPRPPMSSTGSATCKKLGINVNRALVDFALYRRRLLEQYDYDMVVIVEGNFTLPQCGRAGRAVRQQAAAEEGNGNYRGVKSRAADALIEAMNARQHAARTARRRARLRPRGDLELLADTRPVQREGERLALEQVRHPGDGGTLLPGRHPDRRLREHGPWPLWTWWDKSLEKARLEG
jgi:microcin C transport system substrate-binding protein